MTSPSPLPLSMALHHLVPQVLMDREIMARVTTVTEANQAMFGYAHMGMMMPAPIYGEGGFSTAGEVGGKKRPRELLSFVGDDISTDLQKQVLNHDCLFVHHAQQVREEFADRWKWVSRQLVAAVEDGIRKRLKAKDDEIEAAKKLNWALEERVRSLCVETQIWRELAQTNEVTANLLHANLEQVLLAQQQAAGCVNYYDSTDQDVADDAESCCEGSEKTQTVPLILRTCRSCCDSEPTVLLLPCRHLCLCASCDQNINSCPICNCTKSGSVNVNLL